MVPPDYNDIQSDISLDDHGASGYIVQPTLPTAPNQPLPLASQASPSSSSTVRASGVSVDGATRVFPGGDHRARIINSSNPKPWKKKNGYYHRRSGEKKERLIWTTELHQCFLKFYNRFPNEKRVPKKILEEMRRVYPSITRENVASHLQKHRLNIKQKKDKAMGNSPKSSSKSVPLKRTKEEAYIHQILNNTAISTTHNAVEFTHQSHSISTNPNLNPNSQLPLQSHSISTAHNSQLPFQFHSLHGTVQNQAFSQFNETHLLHQDMVYAQSLFDVQDMVNAQSLSDVLTDLSIYSNMVNALESQRSPIGGQSLNAASCFPVRVNHFPPPVSYNHELLINVDAHGNSFHPMMGNSFGGSSTNNYSFGALPHFLDYNMNSNWDNVQVDGMNDAYFIGGYSNSLQPDYPSNFNVQNELQPQDFDQAVQSIFYPPAINYASPLPQNFVPENREKIKEKNVMNERIDES